MGAHDARGAHDRAVARMTARPASGGLPAPTDAIGTPEPTGTGWDDFVEGNPRGSYLQLSGWARVKAVNGWTSHHLLDPDSPSVGAQVLLRRPGPLPWAFAYAPRGPVLDAWDADSVARLTQLARLGLRAGGRVSHLRIDPEIEAGAGPDDGGAVASALQASGWRPADPIQPVSTRVIDLTADEDALYGDLRKKWRQYVNKAQERRRACRGRRPGAARRVLPHLS